MTGPNGCTVPWPDGWVCTRAKHPGTEPCAAVFVGGEPQTRTGDEPEETAPLPCSFPQAPGVACTRSSHWDRATCNLVDCPVAPQPVAGEGEEPVAPPWVVAAAHAWDREQREWTLAGSFIFATAALILSTVAVALAAVAAAG